MKNIIVLFFISSLLCTVFAQSDEQPLPRGPLQIAVYPNSQELDINLNTPEKVIRFFDCPGVSKQVEGFYRVEYEQVSVSKIFVGFIHTLRIKLRLPEQTVDIVHFAPLLEGSQWDEKQILTEEILEKKYTNTQIEEELNYLQKSYNKGEIEKDYLLIRTDRLKTMSLILSNTKSYADLVALHQSFLRKANVLIITQDRVFDSSLTVPETGENPKNIDLSNVLAKDIPELVFPRVIEISHEQVDEGLRRTSKKRSIFRTLYVCKENTNAVERFYRTNHQTSVSKIQSYCFRVSKFKFSVPELHSKIEIALYDCTVKPGSETWKANKKRLQERIATLEQPAKTIDREIEALTRLYQENQLTQDIFELRVEELQRRRASLLNTPSYRDVLVMQQAFKTKQNILVITQTKQLSDEDF